MVNFYKDLSIVLSDMTAFSRRAIGMSVSSKYQGIRKLEMCIGL